MGEMNSFDVCILVELTLPGLADRKLSSGQFGLFHHCRGYWHGSVYIRTRKPSGEDDFRIFLDEVATLSCIRHENIQLFMGVCLDMDGGALGIIMR